MNYFFLVVILSVTTGGGSYATRTSSGIDVTPMPNLKVCEAMVKDIKNNVPRVGEFENADPHEIAVYCKTVSVDSNG